MKQAIKSVLFIVTTLILVSIVSEILQLKSRTPVMDEFYRQDKNEIQVVCLGASHIMQAMSPMTMYKNHGITSYTFGTGNQLIESSSCILKEVYKTQQPEVVILEVGNLFYDDAEKAKKNNSLMNQFHISENRLEVANAIAGYGDSPYKDTFMSFFPLYTYHSRWKELTSDDFYLFEKDNRTKGQLIYSDIYEKNVYKNTFLSEDNDVEPLQIPSKNTEYVRKIKELCDENGSTLLLVTTPSVFWNKQREKAVMNLASELDVDYLNTFLPEGELFDYSVDMSDNNHLNSGGAEKFTEYIAEYIEENYKVEGKGLCADYDAAVVYFDKYKDYYDTRLETDCLKYLERITSEDSGYAYSICIQRDEYELLSSEVKDKLLQLGIDGTFEDGNVCIAFYEGQNLLSCEYINYQTEYSLDAGRYGTITFLNEGGMPKKYSYREPVSGNFGGLNILLFDCESGLKMDYVNFAYADGEMKFMRLNPDDEMDNDELTLYRRWLLKNY